jgi:pimeloyl-ACP methyl ester carboxylesterase
MPSTTVAVGDLRFDADVDGPDDGEVVLFLHGFPESRAEWRLVVPELVAAGYRCIAVDQRGYSPGARPAERSAYATRHLAADVLGVADALGVERFHLVGHDWGAIVGWWVAARHPDRVRSLAALSVPHPRAYLHALRHDPAQWLRSAYVAAFRVPGLAERLLLARGAAGLRRMLGELPPDLREAHVDLLRQPGALTAALDWYRAVDPELGRTPAVTVPTMHVWSTKDVSMTPTGPRDTARWVSGPYRFEVLDGVSHWLPEVAPQRTAALLLDHLATT